MEPKFKNMVIPPYATINHAGEFLGIKRSTVYSHVTAGHIRMVKAGGRSLIDMTSALNWLASLPPATPQVYQTNRKARQEKARSKA